MSEHWINRSVFIFKHIRDMLNSFECAALSNLDDFDYLVSVIRQQHHCLLAEVEEDRGLSGQIEICGKFLELRDLAKRCFLVGKKDLGLKVGEYPLRVLELISNVIDENAGDIERYRDQMSETLQGRKMNISDLADAVNNSPLKRLPPTSDVTTIGVDPASSEGDYSALYPHGIPNGTAIPISGPDQDPSRGPGTLDAEIEAGRRAAEDAKLVSDSGVNVPLEVPGGGDLQSLGGNLKSIPPESEQLTHAGEDQPSVPNPDYEGRE